MVLLLETNNYTNLYVYKNLVNDTEYPKEKNLPRWEATFKLNVQDKMGPVSSKLDY
jgi:hypothetical protein